MVEIEKKYEIGERRFGHVNWIGVWTLYQKEILRFLNVWIQTLFSPLITSLLFLLLHPYISTRLSANLQFKFMSCCNKFFSLWIGQGCSTHNNICWFWKVSFKLFNIFWQAISSKTEGRIIVIITNSSIKW